jgi:hypothetical protein
VKSVVISIFFILSLAAASTLPDYPSRNARECPVTVENIGVLIGLEPVENYRAQSTYFQTDLARKGYVPIFLVIENGTRADSFIFDKTKVTYGPADSAVSAARTGTGAGKAIALSAIPFFGPFAGAKVISNASQIQVNLLKKEIQSTTLSPGASTRGFLYIPIPGKTFPREKITLRVPISRAGTNETFDLNLVF